MARNRKRAKERRPHEPGEPSGGSLRPGVVTRQERGDERGEVPEPLSQAAPDAELAAAQVALGRPELAREDDYDEDQEPSDSNDDVVDEEELELEATAGGSGRRAGTGALEPSGGTGGGAIQPRQRTATRVVQFLQGSWRELQRVQWPNRQQVMQATGVVIGFVIVAGVFLGLADYVATKLVNLILQ